MKSLIRIIPSLLISNGRLVKGKKFDNHRDVGEPHTTALALGSQNADEMLVCDLDAYIDRNINPDYSTLLRISKATMTPLTFGGGINSLDKAKKAFDNGADKIYLNSVLFENINLVEKIANIYGSQSIMLGVNIMKKKGKLNIYNKPEKNLMSWFNFLQELKIGEIKVTFVDLEGSQNGMDIETSKKLIKHSKLPLIFEGGIGNLEHIILAIKNDIRSISLGTMINFLDYNIIKIKQYIHNNNYEVRLK